MRERIDLWIDFLNPRQVRLDNLDWRYFFTADQAGDV
jgi:hypothetical protein